MDNEDFKDKDNIHVEELLKDLGFKIRYEGTEGVVRDYNGNTVGSWSIK